MYASSVWTSSKKMLLERVLRMQKRVVCIILSAPRTSRTVTLLKNYSGSLLTMKHTSIAVHLLSKG